MKLLFLKKKKLVCISDIVVVVTPLISGYTFNKKNIRMIDQSFICISL